MGLGCRAQRSDTTRKPRLPAEPIKSFVSDLGVLRGLPRKEWYHSLDLGLARCAQSGHTGEGTPRRQIPAGIQGGICPAESQRHKRIWIMSQKLRFWPTGPCLGRKKAQGQV